MLRGGWIKFVFQPDVEGDVTVAYVNMPRGTPVETTAAAVKQLTEAAAGVAAERRGKPYWMTEALVTLQRETYSAFDQKTEKSRRLWNQPRRFSVPAFTCPLDTLINLGTDLLWQPPKLHPGQPLPFAPVTLHPQDVAALVDFIVVAIEAERTDKVKRIDFSARLSPPSLWILPV